MKSSKRRASYRRLCAYPQTSSFPVELSHFVCLDEQLGFDTTKVFAYQDPCLTYTVASHTTGEKYNRWSPTRNLEQRGVMSFIHSESGGKGKGVHGHPGTLRCS